MQMTKDAPHAQVDGRPFSDICCPYSDMGGDPIAADSGDLLGGDPFGSNPCGDPVGGDPIAADSGDLLGGDPFSSDPFETFSGVWICGDLFCGNRFSNPLTPSPPLKTFVSNSISARASSSQLSYVHASFFCPRIRDEMAT